MADGTVSPASPEYLTAVDQNEDKTMMTMTSLSGFLSQNKIRSETESIEGSAPKPTSSSTPATPFMAAVVRAALVAILIYQSKALRQCVCIALLFLILLILWLILRIGNPRPTTPQAPRTTTAISADVFDVTSDASEKTDAANKTLLLYDINALSLLNDMTVPNHVLDLDPFAEAAR